MSTKHDDHRKIIFRDDRMFTKVRIVGTDVVVFSVYEPSTMFGPHGTFTHEGDDCWGRIGTRRPSKEVLAMPVCADERVTAVKAHYAAEYERAYPLIVEVFPEAGAPGTIRRSGEIEGLA